MQQRGLVNDVNIFTKQNADPLPLNKKDKWKK